VTKFRQNRLTLKVEVPVRHTHTHTHTHTNRQSNSAENNGPSGLQSGQKYMRTRSKTKQAGRFLRPDCARSSECARASIAARRRAAGSITIFRRASCCCSSAIAGIAIGANFKTYLLRQFCWNRVEFFTIHRRQRRRNGGPEFWNSILKGTSAGQRHTDRQTDRHTDRQTDKLGWQ